MYAAKEHSSLRIEGDEADGSRPATRKPGSTGIGSEVHARKWPGLRIPGVPDPMVPKLLLSRENSSMNTPVETHFLILAITVISSALVCYTIGVWGERIQKGLRLWHVVFFCLGICADIAGTTLMEHIAKLTGSHDRIHTVTGSIAVVLMLIHAVWAVATYAKGSEKAKRRFSRFSVFVWCVWLIPYFIGVYIGMTMHP